MRYSDYYSQTGGGGGYQPYSPQQQYVGSMQDQYNDYENRMSQGYNRHRPDYMRPHLGNPNPRTWVEGGLRREKSPYRLRPRMPDGSSGRGNVVRYQDPGDYEYGHTGPRQPWQGYQRGPGVRSEPYQQQYQQYANYRY